MGWVMFLLGLVLPVAFGWWLLRVRRADVLLTLIGLSSLPFVLWSGALGGKIGPCTVGSCMSSAQHSRLVFGLAALALVIVAFILLALQRRLAGGAALVVADAVGAFSVTGTDPTSVVTLAVLAGGAAAYVVWDYARRREAGRVPDYPPPYDPSTVR